MDLVRDLMRGAVPVHVLHHAAEDGGVYGAWMADCLLYTSDAADE